MTGLDLSAVPLEQLVAEVFRRVGMFSIDGTPEGVVRADTVTQVVSAPTSADTTEVERRREYWRRSKAAQRARRRAECPADMSATRAVVVVNTRNNNNKRDMSADIEAADMLPGTEDIGPTPEPSPAEPDDLRRRRLRLGVAELLARAELNRQRAVGRHVANEGGWLRTVAASQAEQRADEITTAVETALARWDTATTATHVASLLERPAATAARTARHHVDVELPERLPLVEARAGFAALKAALQRTA